MPSTISSSAARAALDASCSERDLQAAIVELARLHGWAVWHDYDSRRNLAGMPDLILCRPPRLLAVELKTERGRLRPPQRRWLALLAACGVETYVWRPSMWSDIEEALK